MKRALSTPESASTGFATGSLRRGPLASVSPNPGSSEPSPPVAQWYCLRARQKREHFAAQQLAERTGLEAFSPRLSLLRPRRDGTTASTVEALFPGYVFARFRLPEDSRFVGSTPDITGIVHFGAHTPPVPDTLIALLREHASPGRPCAPVLAHGDWVKVLAGSLVGSEGRLVAFDSGQSRAWVLLSLLGQDLRVSLPATALRRTGPGCIHFPPQLLASCG